MTEMDGITIVDIATAIVFALAIVLGLSFGGLVIWTIWDLVVYQIKWRKDKKKGAEDVGRRSG